ncbi:MAG: hypothetical protein HY749_16300 [Gammaproteobacteria bacterium]|nr:hypothetical protein [Gammaproteobacteria bacterium]
MSVLGPEDFDSRTWRKLREHLNARLVALRTRNDIDQPAEKTASLRGRISQIKELLALERAPDPETAEETPSS